jgi:hypothetical protein
MDTCRRAAEIFKQKLQVGKKERMTARKYALTG